jgi:peroxiredoxin Q/BCP
MTVRVGDVAPLFEAAGTGDRTYSLAAYRGKPVVLVFYPGDATPVCTAQLSSYNEGLGALQELDAAVLALSPQDVESHEKFSADHGFAFPLLYDADKAIGEQYGVLGPLGFYRRSVFVVDAGGVLRYVNLGMAGLSYPSVDDITAAVKALPPVAS